jgi:hypothetical protein
VEDGEAHRALCLVYALHVEILVGVHLVQRLSGFIEVVVDLLGRFDI